MSFSGGHAHYISKLLGPLWNVYTGCTGNDFRKNSYAVGLWNTGHIVRPICIRNHETPNLHNSTWIWSPFTIEEQHLSILKNKWNPFSLDFMTAWYDYRTLSLLFILFGFFLCLMHSTAAYHHSLMGLVIPLWSLLPLHYSSSFFVWTSFSTISEANTTISYLHYLTLSSCLVLPAVCHKMKTWTPNCVIPDLKNRGYTWMCL